MTALSENTSQAQWHAASCGLRCICLYFAPYVTGWITNKTWSVHLAIKPLRDLQLNSPLLTLIMNIIGVRLAEYPQIILLGRILLPSFACFKWPSPSDLESETQIQTSQLLPICIMFSDSTLALQCCVWWSSGLKGAALRSWIFYLLSAQGWKESSASGNAQKADLI